MWWKTTTLGWWSPSSGWARYASISAPPCPEIVVVCAMIPSVMGTALRASAGRVGPRAQRGRQRGRRQLGERRGPRRRGPRPAAGPGPRARGPPPAHASTPGGLGDVGAGLDRPVVGGPAREPARVRVADHAMAGPLAGPTMQSGLALGHEPGVLGLALADAGRHLVLRRHDQLEGDR